MGSFAVAQIFYISAYGLKPLNWKLGIPFYVLWAVGKDRKLNIFLEDNFILFLIDFSHCCRCQTSWGCADCGYARLRVPLADHVLSCHCPCCPPKNSPVYFVCNLQCIVCGVWWYDCLGYVLATNSKCKGTYGKHLCLDLKIPTYFPFFFPALDYDHLLCCSIWHCPKYHHRHIEKEARYNVTQKGTQQQQWPSSCQIKRLI